MEPYYETIDRPGWYRRFDGRRPPVITDGIRSFYENGVEVTDQIDRESSNEFNPPPSEPWDVTRYKKFQDLGKGTQASVGQFRDLVDGREYAIKHYEIWVNTKELREKYTNEQREVYTKKLRDNVIREIAIMATLSCDPEAQPHMVRLIRWHETHEKLDDGSEKHDIRLVMYPVASELSLGDKLNAQFGSPTFQEIITQNFLEEALRDLTQGLSLIHKHSVRHKDINAQNVVVNQLVSRLKVLYTDFGISLYFDPQASATGSSSTDNPTESTLYDNTYAAPELLDGQPRSTKSDVFSLGCVMWEILVARSVPVLRKKDYMNATGFGDGWGYERGEGYARMLRDGSLPLAFRQMRAEEHMKEYHWIIDVIERMTKDNPDERLSASQVPGLVDAYTGWRDDKNMFISSEWDHKLFLIDSGGKSGTVQFTRRVGTREVIEEVYQS
ncbi:kinase-like domain-containing protein [Lophiotrema nucula]|uniref:Kinase-like domain-containing protein n=1 Tax=Lophiotrema nucula TaxID=690887 RepID=A0A6A5YKI2_9PLEO|nr:kinase-like domain-containing protein [Lophiotrema nucula]